MNSNNTSALLWTNVTWIQSNFLNDGACLHLITGRYVEHGEAQRFRVPPHLVPNLVW